MWRIGVWRVPAGQVFELREPGVTDGAAAESLVADCRGPRRDEQIAETKPPAGDCSRILGQSPGPTRVY